MMHRNISLFVALFALTISSAFSFQPACYAQDENESNAAQAEVSQEDELASPAADDKDQAESEAAEHAADEHAADQHASDGDAHAAADGHAEDPHAADSHATGDDHAGEAHVGNNPLHGNVDDKTWEVVDFRTDMAFFSLFVFILLVLGLTFTAWKPIMDALESREQGIAKNITDAEQAAESAKAKLAEYEAKLAEAETEAQEIIAEARRDAEVTSQKLIAEAQEEAVRHRERATADIHSAKLAALSELASESTGVAMTLAERIVGREVKADDHQGMIQDMLSKLPSNN